MYLTLSVLDKSDKITYASILSATNKIRGHRAECIIIDDPIKDANVIEKPTQNTEAQKEALSLFAAGYRPLKNQPMTKVGKIDIAKIRNVKGKLTPMLVEQAAGIPWYSKDKKDIDSAVFHALYRLTTAADTEAYRLLIEQHNVSD